MTEGFETCLDKNQTHTLAVEDKIFEALEKVTMVKDRKAHEAVSYSKAGRTDAGVSSVGQVISLNVRVLTRSFF